VGVRVWDSVAYSEKNLGGEYDKEGERTGGERGMATLQSVVLQRGRRTEGCTGERKRGTGETQKRRANTEIAKHFDQTFFKFDDTACLSGV